VVPLADALSVCSCLVVGPLPDLFQRLLASWQRKVAMLVAPGRHEREAGLMALNDLGRSCSLIFPTWWRWLA
jgi:hypothetical protein